MEITDIEVTVSDADPKTDTRRDALQELPGAGSVTVEVRTASGVTGSGSVRFGRIQAAPDVLATLIRRELLPIVMGSDPRFVRRIHEELLDEVEYHGTSGLARFGIAALDTALWDFLGAARDVSCWELWGGVRERIPVYAMVGWLDDELEPKVEAAVEQGFRGIKLKVGESSLRADIERLQRISDIVDEDIDIMVDANQTLTVAEARRRGRSFEEFGCRWWEEPIPAHDIEGYAELVSALDIPVATGENLYTRADFARLFNARGVDIVQPDRRRVGGPTCLLQIGTMADAHGIPYASHGGGPVQLSVLACLPNALYLETEPPGPNSPMEITDGHVEIPQGAGFSWE